MNLQVSKLKLAMHKWNNNKVVNKNNNKRICTLSRVKLPFNSCRLIIFLFQIMTKIKERFKDFRISYKRNSNFYKKNNHFHLSNNSNHILQSNKKLIARS